MKDNRNRKFDAQRRQPIDDNELPPIDRYGIKPHSHTPIKNEKKLKELEEFFNRIKKEVKKKNK